MGSQKRNLRSSVLRHDLRVYVRFRPTLRAVGVHAAAPVASRNSLHPIICLCSNAVAARRVPREINGGSPPTLHWPCVRTPTSDATGRAGREVRSSTASRAQKPPHQHPARTAAASKTSLAPAAQQPGLRSTHARRACGQGRKHCVRPLRPYSHSAAPGTRPLRAVGQARDPGFAASDAGDGPQAGRGGALGAEGIRQPGSPGLEGGLSREMPASGALS